MDEGVRDLTDLDKAALANLSSSDLLDYYRYRDELISEKNPDIDDILIGYLWDATEEEYNEEDYDTDL